MRRTDPEAALHDLKQSPEILHFYDVYANGDDYLGLSPSADQSLAGSLMMLEGSLVTIVAIAWLFLRMAQEGEVRQRLLESGVDERTARRAVRYRRWKELEGSTP